MTSKSVQCNPQDVIFDYSLDVIETDRTLQLTVSRDRGTYGAVTVFIYSQPVDARKGSDYSFSDQVFHWPKRLTFITQTNDVTMDAF